MTSSVQMDRAVEHRDSRRSHACRYSLGGAGQNICCVQNLQKAKRHKRVARSTARLHAVTPWTNDPPLHHVAHSIGNTQQAHPREIFQGLLQGLHLLVAALLGLVLDLLLALLSHNRIRMAATQVVPRVHNICGATA